MYSFPLISIIIPAYNCEAYIQRAIESILSQTYPNIELIVINDGSTDGTSKILDEYRDSIIVENICNGGVANARNVGFSLSHGAYVSYIDADDYVDKDYVKVLYETLINNNVLISTCHAHNILPDGSIINSQPISDTMVSVVSYENYNFLSSYAHYVAWGALYKREIVQNILFSSDYLVAEDTLYFSQALKIAGMLADINSPLYYYTYQEQSLSKGEYGMNQFCEILAWDKIAELYSDQNRDSYLAVLSSRSIRVLKGIHLDIRYNGINNQLRSRFLDYSKKDLHLVLQAPIKLQYKTALVLYSFSPLGYSVIYWLYSRVKTRLFGHTN